MAQAMEMSQQSITEYTQRMRGRYRRRTGKRARSKLLDEFIEVTGYERKYANKILRNQRRGSDKKSRRGAPVRYGAELLPALKTCWLAMEQPCGKRMADMLPLWVDHLEKCKPDIRRKLLKISSASIDRLLRPVKTGSGRKRLPPRGHSAIKAQVEIRAESWDTQEAGWTEVELGPDILPGRFDINLDGERFLMRRRVSGEESGTYAKHINVVFNWFTELNEMAPPTAKK